MRLLFVAIAAVFLLPLACWFITTLVATLLDHRRHLASINVEMEKVKRAARNNNQRRTN